MASMRRMMERLKLTVNEEKTHICKVPDQYFDFLGYTFGRFYPTKTGKTYIGTRPSKKSVKRMIEAISADTDRSLGWKEADAVVMQLNRKLTGWANYFRLGPVSKAYRAVEKHTTNRFRRWLHRRHKAKGTARSCYPDTYLHQKLGLVHLPSLTKSFPWANA